MVRMHAICEPMEFYALTRLFEADGFRIEHLDRDDPGTDGDMALATSAVVYLALSSLDELPSLIARLERAAPEVPVVFAPHAGCDADALWRRVRAPGRSVLRAEAGEVEIRCAVLLAREGYSVAPRVSVVPSRPVAPTPAKHLKEARLTVRELEIAEAVRIGLSNKEIAQHLGISPHTVNVHVGSILRKLGARNRTQIALQASGEHSG
ncbi:regulatory protein, luxR family [Roseivivax marinus]|nr:LuxR C-terminal-related transcriptional regulator [Roseivivax marinus]SEL19422.1 regulatory protein, luxR family [Roseivivax marinus]